MYNLDYSWPMSDKHGMIAVKQDDIKVELCWRIRNENPQKTWHYYSSWNSANNAFHKVVEQIKKARPDSDKMRKVYEKYEKRWGAKQ